MDAKVDDWVVTPRRGKAVEINALWYNALRLLDGWIARARRRRPRARPGAPCRARARVVQPPLLVRGGGLSLRRRRRRARRRSRPAGRTSCLRSRSTIRCSIASRGRRSWRWSRQRLLTPVGLRSLAPGHPDYKAKYYGDLRSRDAAYHQGTVWGWLIGPFVDAWLKVLSGGSRGRARAARGLRGASEQRVRRIDQRDLRRRSSRTRRAAASRRRGASPKCCGASRRPGRVAGRGRPGRRRPGERARVTSGGSAAPTLTTRSRRRRAGNAY